MKLLAQHGFGPKDKLSIALNRNLINGAILSPRYARPERMQELISEIHDNGGITYLDPEYFATGFIPHPDPNLGSLEEWNYFHSPRRSRMISGAAIPDILKKTVGIQHDLGATKCIAPNLYIRQADSIDTAIALNFLNQTKIQAAEVTDREVYGTIAIHRDALLSENTVRDILDGLTGLEDPPDGYYLIIGSNELQSTGNFIRSDLYQSEVIAACMYINYVLSLNGSRVINGYCFLLSPLMAICGAEACASGWSSGLRKFCINRYARQGRGGRQANARYLSNPLLSFITQTDYDAYKEVVPEIQNGLSMDSIYDSRDANQTEQALQSWEALDSLISDIPGDISEIVNQLEIFKLQADEARQFWSRIQNAGFLNEIELNLERLEIILEGIQLFTEWAELA